MYLFKDYKNNYYTYIHIPKNSGKYIRKKIDDKYIRLLYMWGKSQNIDNAHLSYLDCFKKIKLSKKVPEVDHNKIFFFTFIRNPYDRVISAYHYLKYNNRMNFDMFLKNIINKAMKIRLNKVCLSHEPQNIKYEEAFIHLYPQYLFLLDENNNVSPNIKIEKLEDCTKNHDLFDFYDFQIKKYDYSHFYTSKEHYEIVNDFYSKDFEYFGYEKITMPNNTNTTNEIT
jgi:hypothetical protein